MYDSVFVMTNYSFGYKKVENPFVNSYEYMEALEMLSDMEFPDINNQKIPKKDKKYVLNMTEQIMKEQFLEGVDTDVPYIAKTRKEIIIGVMEKLNSQYYITEEDLEEFLKLQEELVDQISAFKIPVEDIPNRSFDVGIIERGFPCVADEEYLKRVPKSASVVRLGGNYNVLSIGMYGHEIVHLLLEKHRGSVENVLNQEVLSIFMEKAITDQVDTTPNKNYFKICELFRMSNAKEALFDFMSQTDFEQRVESLKYLYGSLVAGVLHNKYREGSPEVKLEIKNSIKQLFNGKTTLEKLLEEQHIRLDNDSVIKYLEKIDEYAKEFQVEHDER